MRRDDGSSLEGAAIDAARSARLRAVAVGRQTAATAALIALTFEELACRADASAAKERTPAADAQRAVRARTWAQHERAQARRLWAVVEGAVEGEANGRGVR